MQQRLRSLSVSVGPRDVCGHKETSHSVRHQTSAGSSRPVPSPPPDMTSAAGSHQISSVRHMILVVVSTWWSLYDVVYPQPSQGFSSQFERSAFVQTQHSSLAKSVFVFDFYYKENLLISYEIKACFLELQAYPLTERFLCSTPPPAISLKLPAHCLYRKRWRTTLTL